ncbi:MAG TPA: MmcQ/YjbR family DNA-binding protein [Caulobacter sp.]|nr:MmcQ/YjbR family DNA-binding protein [Caulobacter sp.]
MTRDEFHAIVMAFPGVEEAPSYGQPSYKVNGKFLTRVRKDDASAVIMEVSFDERDLLLEVEPETFHFTAHYKDYPCVLARLETLSPDQLKGFLERRWRKAAKKAEVKAWEAAKVE